MQFVHWFFFLLLTENYNLIFTSDRNVWLQIFPHPKKCHFPKKSLDSSIPQIFPKRCWNSQSRDKFPKSGNPVYLLNTLYWNFFTLVWKIEFALKFSTVLNIFFSIQDFWATCACPEKQSVPWIHCIEYIFFIIQDFRATCACPEKQSCPEIFHCIEIFFIIQDFWVTCACPENRVCPEFTVLNVYFLSFRIFEQIALALKTEVALKFFKTRGAASPPPRTPMFAHSRFENSPKWYSNHRTDKPHHLPSQSRLFQHEAKLICTSPLPRVQPTAQLASAVEVKSEMLSTHDVTKLFNRQGEHPGCFKSAKVWLYRFFCFVYLTSGVLQQPAFLLEQTIKNRSAVLRNISVARKNNTNRGSA